MPDFLDGSEAARTRPTDDELCWDEVGALPENRCQPPSGDGQSSAEVLSDVSGSGILVITVDAYINQGNAFVMGENRRESIELSWSIDAVPGCSKRASKGNEIRGRIVGVAGGRSLANQVVALLPHGLVIEHEDGQRQ